MGAYLSSPIRDKVSEDDERPQLRYGASSMQGWRMSQEDAHNCTPDFDPDTNTSLFACYDGHGGAEVAMYTAQNFPDFLKSLPLYMEGKLSEALEEAFLDFDDTLTKENVVQKLKEIACLEEDGEQEEGEAAALYEEATMPLEELLERYGRSGAKKKLLAKDNIQSPAIRPRKVDLKLTDEKDSKDDVKMKLDNELMNGHGEDENGLEKGHGSQSTDSQANEAQAKEESDSSKNIPAAGVEADSSCVDSTTTDEPQKVATGTDCDGDSENKQNDTETNQAVATENSEPSQVNPAPTPSTTSTSSGEGSKDTEGPSSTSQSTQDSQVKEEAAGSSAQSSSSGSCRVGSTSGAGGSGVGSSSSSAGAGSSSAGAGSSSSSVGSSASGSGISGAGGSSSGSSDMGPCSSSKDEEPQAGSSSGRVRHKRKNIIPEEGEDESSFDEDSDDDSESGDEDEPRPWASGSDDSSDDDEGMPESEEDEDDGWGSSDGCGEMGSGEPGSDSGCTAVVSLLRGRELYVANAGDSRCVVCRGGKAMDMSVDHKPEDEVEHSRVTKAGGRVTLDGRVNGGLNMSRAIGDHCYKQNKDLPAREQMITALPEVRSTTLEDRDTFMVLACDGIWNVMSSQDVVNFVGERLKGGATKLSAICEEMFEYCLAPDTSGDGTGCDNMTCIIVTFDHGALDAMGSASKKRHASNDTPDDTGKSDLPETKKQKTEDATTS